MDKAQSHPDETRPDDRGPSDSDLRWTEWALGMLREMAEIDMRSKRLAAQHQAATPAGPGLPDFPLMQSRLSRSLRLTIAMIERIRIDYLIRRDGREKSGEQARRRQRREQAADAVARAITVPGEGWRPEDVRPMVWEKLVEDEILDVQIDTLSPEAFVQAVCHKIGYPPVSDPQPWGRDNEAEAETGDEVDREPADVASREPAEGRPHPANDSAADRPMPGPPKPDSS